MPKRPPHKTAHAPCPNGASNWADCDEAVAHQWGRCKAVVGKTEPEACTRWAVSDEGYCGQHYTARVEDEKRKAREAEYQLQLVSRIDAFLASRDVTAHSCELGHCPFSHRAPEHVCAPGCVYWVPRRGPFKLTELA